MVSVPWCVLDMEATEGGQGDSELALKCIVAIAVKVMWVRLVGEYHREYVALCTSI